MPLAVGIETPGALDGARSARYSPLTMAAAGPVEAVPGVGVE